MNVNKKMPIGVFDSGIGGLTVLYRLIEMFPNENFIYVGDTANLPYGTKTNEEVKGLVSNVCNYLVESKVKSIVIACNTATTNSSHLKETIDIPIVGVIEPTAKYALELSENILVLATNVTIKSNAYQNLIESNKKDPLSKQFFVACSEFVDSIEANDINTESSYALVEQKLKPFTNEKIDVIILGCTHFGLYSNEIKRIFPQAKLVECAIPTGNKLKLVLEDNNLLNDSLIKGKVKIYLTKKQENFYDKTKWFDKPYEGYYELDLKNKIESFKSNDCLSNFLDSNGMVTKIPSKFEKAKIVMDYLGEKFIKGKHYSEKEVNEIIKNAISFSDFSLVRRTLVDLKILNRTDNGNDYWKN